MHSLQIVAQVALRRFAAGALTHLSRDVVIAPAVAHLPLVQREATPLGHDQAGRIRPATSRLVRYVPSRSHGIASPLTRFDDAEKAFLQKNIRIALKTRRREELEAGSPLSISEHRFRRDWIWRSLSLSEKTDFWINQLENEIDDLVAEREGVVKKFFLGRETQGSGPARKRVREIGTLLVTDLTHMLEDLLDIDARTPDFYLTVLRFKFRMACIRYLETAGRQGIGRGTLTRIKNLASRCLGEIRRIQGLTA